MVTVTIPPYAVTDEYPRLEISRVELKEDVELASSATQYAVPLFDILKVISISFLVTNDTFVDEKIGYKIPSVNWIFKIDPVATFCEQVPQGLIEEACPGHTLPQFRGQLTQMTGFESHVKDLQ